MNTSKSSYNFSNIVVGSTITLAEADKVNTIVFDNQGNTDVFIDGNKLVKAGDSTSFGGRDWAIIVDSFVITFGAGTTPRLDIIKETLTNL